jgi:DNA-binding NtrC family response regulator
MRPPTSLTSQVAPTTTADILVVDDDEDLAAIVADVLALRGHRVRLACGGHDGLRLLHERLPDLVILDVEMPDLTGPQMAYRMFIHDAGLEDVPIVLVSGAVGLPAVAARAGIPYALAKPFDLDQLLTLVERALTERRPPKPRL